MIFFEKLFYLFFIMCLVTILLLRELPEYKGFKKAGQPLKYISLHSFYKIMDIS